VAAVTASLVVVGMTGIAFAVRAGTPDDSFGRHGKVLLHQRGYASSVEVGPHHRIVLGGANFYVNTTRFTLARLRSDGRLDPSFAGDGTKKTRFGTDANLFDIALDSRGGIVAAGETCADGDHCDGAVVRYTRDGHLKRSFGHRGKLRVEYAPGFNQVTAAHLASHHRILIAGDTSPDACCAGQIGVARLNPDGSLDRSFGTDGKTVVAFPTPPPCSGALDMAIDSHHRIVVAGECHAADVMYAARFTRDGKLDQTFGKDGFASLRGRFAPQTYVATGVDSQDRVYVSGTAIHTVGFAVARFTARGEIDRSYGRKGVGIERFEDGISHDLAIDSKDRAVLAGGDRNTYAFARFKRNGDVDRSFGENGRAIVRNWGAANARPDGAGWGWALGIDIDGRGRILGAGFRHHHFAAARVHG
jgi:uncharacterized delta-60 repeat protein